MLPAPPAAAANVATVPRRMFTCGSTRVNMRGAVVACRRRPGIAAPAPATSSTRHHRRRSARSLASERKKSASTASAKPIWPAAAAAGSPRSTWARR